MPKPTIGQSNWGDALNAHLDDLAADTATRQPVSTLDAAIAAHADNAASALRTSLSATYAKKAVDATQALVAKIKANLADPVMLIVGDSTTAEPGRWVGYMATELAAKFPTHSIVLHQFNISGSLTYDAASTLHTGTGARTLHIWNAAIGGHYTGSWKGAKGAAAFDGLNPDLTLISLGHNEGAVAISDRWHGQMLGLTEDLTARSDTPLIIISQNPQMSGPGVSLGEQEERREVYRNIAAHRGYGFIDVCQAFLDSGQAYELTSDGTHPTAAGYQLWADVVAGAFDGDHKNGAPRSQSPSCFNSAGPSLIRNGTFESGTAHWLLQNATATTDATHTEGNAVKVTNLGGGAGYIYQDLPVDRVKGRWITVAARVYVPAGTVDSAGLLALDDSVGSSTSTGHPHGKDGFRWDVVTRFIPAAATTPRVKVYASSAASTDSVWVERVIVVEGRYPRDVARAEAGGEWKNYVPTLSTNITLGSGTIVAAYRQDPLSKTIDVYVRITLAADSTISGAVTTTVGLPVNLLSAATVVSTRVNLIDTSAGATGRYLGNALALNLDKLTLYALGTSGASVGITGTAPFTWASTDVIEMGARYRYA